MNFITCERCGTDAEKRGATQRFCKECSRSAEAERKRIWAKNNPTPLAYEKIKEFEGLEYEKFVEGNKKLEAQRLEIRNKHKEKIDKINKELK